MKNYTDARVTMPDPAYATRRKWPRFKIDVPIRLIADKGHKVFMIQGRGNDLNEGGMSVFGGVELKVDDHVAVEFTPPYTGQPIRVRARVIHRKGYNYGVEFLLHTSEDLDNVGRLRTALGAMATELK